MSNEGHLISAPFRFARSLLQRIPDRRARAAASFALAFAVSLGVGRAFEIVLDDEQVIAADKVQRNWIASLRSFAPLSLIRGYWDDIGAVQRGDFAYKPPPPLPQPLTDEERAKISDGAAKIAACNLARATFPTISSGCLAIRMSGLSRADCLVNPEKHGCAELNACLEEQDTLLSGPPECVGVEASLFGPTLGASITAGLPRSDPTTTFPGDSTGKPLPIYLAPLAAVFRSVTRVVGENGVAPFVAIGQIVLGFLAFCVVTHVGSKGARIGFDGFFPNLLLAPVLVVALASASAFVIQQLMIGSLGAFSWATSLAAACCGTTSFGAGIWYCVKKLGEKGVEHALTGGR